MAANGLTEATATNLSVGATLTIPTDALQFGDARSLRDHPTTYTTTGIDTWQSIACLFGDVWPEAIAATNGYTLEDPVPAGQGLHIP